MCDECTQMAWDAANEAEDVARAAEARALRAEAQLTEVRRVAAKWMRLALGAPKGGHKNA